MGQPATRNAIVQPASKKPAGMYKPELKSAEVNFSIFSPLVWELGGDFVDRSHSVAAVGCIPVDGRGIVNVKVGVNNMIMSVSYTHLTLPTTPYV